MKQKREAWCLCSLLYEHKKLFCVGTFSAEIMLKNTSRPKTAGGSSSGATFRLVPRSTFYNHKLSNWILP